MGADLISSTTVPSFPIQRATWRDTMAVHQLEKACFPIDSWPLLDIIAVLSLPKVVRLKAMDSEKLVGFVIGDLRPSKGFAWIATVGVHPEYRRKGIGSALLRECERRIELPLVRLSVRVSNRAAIRLYQRYGYQATGTWPRYYKGGEDALVMEKNLNVL